MRFCTENVTGLSILPKLRAAPQGAAVGEHSLRVEARPRGLVDCWEENMLAQVRDKMDEKTIRRKSKVSWGRLIHSGLVGT